MASWLNKWLLISVFPVFFYTSGKWTGKNEFSRTPVYNESTKTHPFHVSVTEIDHNATEKTLEISCKLFTDDFENILEKTFKTKVDLTNPADRPATGKLVTEYVSKNLVVKVDGKPVSLTGIGFEKESEATWCYFQVDNVAAVKKVEMTNTLLYDLFDDQVGIMHVKVDGTRKSTKLSYPAKDAVISF
jgi:hypothetical protein